MEHPSFPLILEALLFTRDKPLTFKEIEKVILRAELNINKDEIKKSLNVLEEKYNNDTSSFSLVKLAGGYILQTKPHFSPYIEALDTKKQGQKLSKAALEVLSIIAYKQPLTRAQIEETRGTDSQNILQYLIEKGLVTPKGQLEAPGRPTLLGTTTLFLAHFGLNSLKDLPKIPTMALDTLKQKEATPESLQSHQKLTEPSLASTTNA